MKNSRSSDWGTIRQLEDVLAVLTGVDQERQKEGLAQLKALLAAQWADLVERTSE